MPQGNPLAYGSSHPYGAQGGMGLAELLSQALSGPATMDPEALKAMQQQMALQQYDQMMRMQQGAPQAMSPQSPAGGGQQQSSMNPFEVLGGVLKQPQR